MPVTIVGNNTPTAGGVVYGDGTNYVSTSAGTAGQVLLSNGASAPSFGAVPTVNLATGVTGTLPVGNGGTGAASLTANNVLLGNGTSAVQVVAPGTNGNVLMSNGTTWTSATPSAGAMVLLSTVTVSSGSSTVDIQTGISSTYDYYVIQFDNVTINNNGYDSAMGVRLRIGGTYQTSGYRYGGSFTTSQSTQAGYISPQNLISDGIPLTVNTISGNPGFYNQMSGQLWFYSPSNTTQFKPISFLTSNITNASSQYGEYVAGSGYSSSAAQAALSGVRFYPYTWPSNTTFLTGNFRLYGIAKT
jgi:hypothetical protein